MKIAAFNVELQSSRQFTQSFEVRERLELWRNSTPSPGRAEENISDAARRAQRADGAAAKAQLFALQGGAMQADPSLADQAQATAGAELDDAVDNDPQLSMLIRMIEVLTGEPVRRFRMSDLEGAASADTGADATLPAQSATTAALPPVPASASNTISMPATPNPRPRASAPPGWSALPMVPRSVSSSALRCRGAIANRCHSACAPETRV